MDRVSIGSLYQFNQFLLHIINIIIIIIIIIIIVTHRQLIKKYVFACNHVVPFFFINFIPLTLSLYFILNMHYHSSFFFLLFLSVCFYIIHILRNDKMRETEKKNQFNF